MKQFVCLLVAFGCVCACVSRAAALSPGRIIEVISYDSERVGVEVLEPAGGGKKPVVIILHGYEGLTRDWKDRYGQLADGLRQEGMIVLLPRYFESTRANHVRTVVECISFAQKLAHADPRRVGIVGFTLGGTLALRAAARDIRVALLALHSCEVPAGFTGMDAARLPRTLFICGEKDRVYPGLKRLYTELFDIPRPAELRIHRGVARELPYGMFEADRDEIVAFFKKHL